MDSGFNIKDSSFALFDGKSVEIGCSLRYRYSKARFHGELLFVKEPTEEYAQDLITIEALKKEFLLGFGLNHPGLVRYYSFENNRLFEEYIEGKTLRQLIDEDNRLLYQKEFVKDLARQILEALKYLHSKGIAHLDLKPENIIVANLGNCVKIIDLSCAESLSGFATPGFTQEYHAPEQVYGRGNINTDIYQLGLILKEITEGRRLEGEWNKFIRKATANHPDNRFQNADEAIKGMPLVNKLNYKWISIIFLTIIIGGVLSLIVTDPVLNTTVEDDTEHVVEIPTMVETPEAQMKSSEPKTKEPLDRNTSSEEQTERNLSNLIEKKLDELFSAKVTPLYQKMMEDEVYKYENVHFEEFVEACSKELNNLMAYGEVLKEEYPDKAFFIDERIAKSFETKTSLMLLKLYPRQDTHTIEEKELVVSSEGMGSIR